MIRSRSALGAVGPFLVVLAVGACAGTAAERPQTPLTDSAERQATELMRVAAMSSPKLDQRARGQLLRLAEQLDCPCRERRGSLAGCALAGSCVRAPFAVRQIIRGALRRESDQLIVTGMLERFGPREREHIALGEAPCRGPLEAPVTVTVFSDFECPACAAGRQLLDVVEHQSKTPLRICYKHFPLQQHLQARIAARAAIAAARQGRFWAYHDRLFDDQRSLSKSDLEQLAEDLGLDLGRFSADLNGEAGREIVESDLREGLRLRVRGTPTFFVNGRQLVGAYRPEIFLDWIEEEVALAAAGSAAAGRR